MIECNTVAELIEILKGCQPSAIVHTVEPPFTGVRIIPQQTGAIMISRPEPMRTLRESDKPRDV